MHPIYVVLFVALSVGWCMILYRAAKKNGVGGFKGYFNAQTLGLPDSMRPFNYEHEVAETLTPKELVITGDPDDSHRRELTKAGVETPSGWVKIDSTEGNKTSSAA